MITLFFIEIWNTDTIKGFDPYDILGIDTGSTEKQIKKAYRKKAIELHPDLNPNDPTA